MDIEKIVALLRERKCTIATAESCTGGLIASKLIAVPGCSDILKVSFITYCEEAKKKYAGVHTKTLNTYGVVSKQVAEEMAIGCMKEANSDFALSSTGIAGPGGGSIAKPVGLVYVACAYEEHVFSHELKLSGTRSQIREEASVKALQLLSHVLEDTSL